MHDKRLARSNADIAALEKKNDRHIWMRFGIISVAVLLFYLIVVYMPVLESKGLFWALIFLPIIPPVVFILVGGLRLFDTSFEGEVTVEYWILREMGINMVFHFID